MVNFLASCSFILFAVLGSASASVDLELMTKARTAFAKQDWEKSFKLYSMVPPSSDFWLDSLEERAWVSVRQDRLEKALGDLHSATAEVWSQQVHPESYVLSTYISLRLCNYKDVIKKIDTFKKKMLPRVQQLQKLVSTSETLELLGLTQDLKKKKLSLAQLGSKADQYPRFFYRDLKVLAAAQADDIEQIHARLKVLAKRDLDEIAKNLNKMKLIEVEMIQNVLTADEIKSNKQKLEFAKYDRDTKLNFPITDSEVWIDEVGSYEVKTLKCPYKGEKI